jgi:FkbM family methyltransferase
MKRRLSKLLQHFPAFYRLIVRLALWRKICRELRPGSIVDLCRLVGSALMDSASASRIGQSHRSPQAYWDLELSATRLNARFFVRRDTDDIYNVLPFRELDVQDSVLKMLRPGDTFVDVGANVGYYSVLGAQAVGPKGKVIAIEAMPQTAEQLAYNLELNGIHNAAIVKKAVQQNPDAEVLKVRVSGGQFGMASLIPQGDETYSLNAEVPATTIDTLCENLDRVRSIKLDIEGSELSALNGATRTLTRTDYVVVECNEDESAICELLSNAGFVVKKLRFGDYLFGSRSPVNAGRVGGFDTGEAHPR